jgi:stage V sporulation protein R
MQRTARATEGLPPALAQQARDIGSVARGYGLSFCEVKFQLLDAADVNGIAAYGGFPVRYPSWRFGMEYERLEKGYRYGASKIYELVINNDPVIAYLVRSNSNLEQKLVMAHVFGHADFFRNNRWFAATDRHMLDTMGRHSARVRALVDRHGQERVERFLDGVLSIDTLIDPYLPLREHASAQTPGRNARPASQPPTFDVIGYLHDHAPLQDWEKELVRIVRTEAYYFQPQRMTKIMNEGWASYWHSRILTGGVLDSSEIVDFADCHSTATASSGGQINPYKLGIELYRYAQEQGLDIFRLRRIHNDTGFVDALLDEAFVEKHRLFVYGKNPRSGRTEVLEREWRPVKERILADLTWGGLPQIELVEVDEGAIVLRHHHDGRDLQLQQASDTLRNIARLWQNHVHLRTVEEGQKKRLICQGEKVDVVEE